MSVTIRLAKVGKKNAPSYKIVVSNTRDKRTGKYLDVLGHFNPSMNPTQYKIDDKKVKEWTGNGAMMSAAVKKLIDGTYDFAPYNPKKAKEEAQQQAESVKNADSVPAAEES